MVEGFQLDRGFQVLLDAYPQARKHLDYAALDLHAFEPGALVFQAGRFQRLSDPWRRPMQALATALARIGTPADKLRVAALRVAARSGSAAGVYTAPEHPTEQTLRERFGFSAGMVDAFFRPFFGGIFLERNLATSDRLMYFVFRMFSEGAATLPAAGMQAIPNQLAAWLPASSIRLNTRVAEVTANGVVLTSGEHLTAAAVVLATDGTAAAALCGDVVSSPDLERHELPLFCRGDRAATGTAADPQRRCECRPGERRHGAQQCLQELCAGRRSARERLYRRRAAR